MSTQVVVMNRRGVAMCTDSAMTIPGLDGQHGVSNSARKLFQATEHIGFMNYNAMSHCCMSMEDILTGFRKRIKEEPGATVSECSRDFLENLKSLEIPPNPESNSNFEQLVLDLASQVKAGSGGLEARVGRLMGQVRRHESLFKIGKEEFFAKNSGFLLQVLQERLGIPAEGSAPDFLSAFSELCREAMSRRYRSTSFAGVVFAGYGANEPFPCVEHWIIDGVYGSELRCWQDQDSCVDLNRQEAADACVVPFAQRDISDLLLLGFDHETVSYVNGSMAGIMGRLRGKATEDLYEESVNGRQINKDSGFSDRTIYNIFSQLAQKRVSALFKRVAKLDSSELAEIAKAFVKVTAARRMIDGDVRTVGGLIDVCVITKSSGFSRSGINICCTCTPNPIPRSY